MCCGEETYYDDYLAEGARYDPTSETDDEKASPNRNCFRLFDASARD